MVCRRCGGFVVAENIYQDTKVASEPSRPPSRCVNCGNLEDPLIRMNRAVRSYVVRSVRHGKVIKIQGTRLLRPSS